MILLVALCWVTLQHEYGADDWRRIGNADVPRYGLFVLVTFLFPPQSPKPLCTGFVAFVDVTA